MSMNVHSDLAFAINE